MGISIKGMGYYTPENVLTNFDLEKTLDTSDEWISQMTGMKERHLSAPDEPTSALAYEASIKAINNAGLKKEDVDYIIVATVSGDYPWPATANVLADRLGLKGVPSMDLSAACAGFVYGLTAAICILFAVLSLWDYRKIRQGKTAEILLQLPKSIKKRIHQTIRAHTRMRGYIVAAFAAGVLVSVFELACTGQVYLPTLVYMNQSALNHWSILLLLLYNVGFILPLSLVFVLYLFGLQHEGLRAWYGKRIFLVRFGTAALFAIMGVAMWI